MSVLQNDCVEKFRNAMFGDNIRRYNFNLEDLELNRAILLWQRQCEAIDTTIMKSLQTSFSSFDQVFLFSSCLHVMESSFPTNVRCFCDIEQWRIKEIIKKQQATKLESTKRLLVILDVRQTLKSPIIPIPLSARRCATFLFIAQPRSEDIRKIPHHLRMTWDEVIYPSDVADVDFGDFTFQFLNDVRAQDLFRVYDRHLRMCKNANAYLVSLKTGVMYICNDNKLCNKYNMELCYKQTYHGEHDCDLLANGESIMLPGPFISPTFLSRCEYLWIYRTYKNASPHATSPHDDCQAQRWVHDWNQY